MAAPSPASTRPSRLTRPTSPDRRYAAPCVSPARTSSRPWRRLRARFPDCPTRPPGSTTRLSRIDAALEGSLGAPRLAGTAASERLRIRSLPALDASATFDVDATRLTVSKAAANDGEGNVFSGRAGIEFEAGTTTGSFSADLKNPAPVLNALLNETRSGVTDDELKAGGLGIAHGHMGRPCRRSGGFCNRQCHGRRPGNSDVQPRARHH